MNVPFCDLKKQYSAIEADIRGAINGVLDSGSYIQGKMEKEFSSNFLKVHGGSWGVGCSNGTNAITAALRTLGVGAGDEVITVANTFFATVEAIAEVGAITKLVDCDPETYSIDTSRIEASITSKTKAIIAVHLYGNPVAMESVQEIARKYDLKVIEDSAQAHLASLKGKAVGTFGDMATFSFYPGKNLGAYGDAGFILSNEEAYHNHVSKLINHGRSEKYSHDFYGTNYRMDEFQAAILNVKVGHIARWTDQRIQAGELYDSLIEKHGFKVIKKEEGAKCVYHLYVVEASNRDEVMAHLKESGVSVGIHYPIPMHLQPACKDLGYSKGDFPVAENSSARIISLPIFPEITPEQQEYIVERFLEVAKN